METRGLLAPEDVAAARESYETAGAVARTVVREVARAMSFDREEYDERVTGEVVETARDAVFASLLAVQVADRAAYHEEGSDAVDRVAWHAFPGAGEAVAATFQDEPDAAVATLRRLAFGRLYRDRL